MGDTNLPSLFSFILTVLITLATALYLVPRQIKQVMRSRSALTPVRWTILAMLIMGILGAFPTMVYQFIRFVGLELLWLRDVATISSSISRLSFFVLIIVIVRIRIISEDIE